MAEKEGRVLERVSFSVARLCGRLSRRAGLGSGSSMPGMLALRLSPNALTRLSQGRRIALVSGTNGKTTVTALLSAALSDDRPGAPSVVTNGQGSNLAAGLVTALLVGRGSVAALEVDEVALPPALSACLPEVVVLLNLSRDQLDRTAEVQTHATRWASSLSGCQATLVANADDPLVVFAVSRARPDFERVEWVGTGQRWHADSAICPSCHTPWQLSIAHWACAHCGLCRPQVGWQLEDGVLHTPTGARVELHTALPGRVNQANAAMAVAAAAALGVAPAVSSARLGQVASVAGRYSTPVVAGRQLRLLLGKNPAGWAELLEDLKGGKHCLIIGINARAADGIDPSWLWDVPFEGLAGRQVIVYGDRALDLSTRLRYADVAHQVAPDLAAAVALVLGESADLVANYTAFSEAAALVSRGLVAERSVKSARHARRMPPGAAA